MDKYIKDDFPTANMFGTLLHKYFRIADGKTKEESDKILAVWSAINNCPDDVWANAILSTFKECSMEVK